MSTTIRNPDPYHFDAFEHGQCDSTTIAGRRCQRGAVHDVTIAGKQYRVCRKHRSPSLFKPFEVRA